MKKMMLLAILLVPAAEAVAIPAEFGVCVTTVDHIGEKARLDSHWSTYEDARARVTVILNEGWAHEGDEYDREDYYPARSVVKVTIDPTLINQPSCVAPPAPVTSVPDGTRSK